MTNESYDFARQKNAIIGHFTFDFRQVLVWFPSRLENWSERSSARLRWTKSKFVSGARNQIPIDPGLYCFTTDLGSPMPDICHVPVLIGKATNLSDRFEKYLQEKSDKQGRPNVVEILNKYHDKLYFYYAKLPRAQIDVSEELLLACCFPPANDQKAKRDEGWTKAF